MTPARTALVLIEYQNDFTTEGGALHEAVKPVMQSTGMLGHTVETVRRAREMGALIVWSPISFAAGYPELNPKPYGILKGVVDSQAFRKGTWGAEITEELTPEPTDIVLEGKRGLDAFASTNLDFILRHRGVETMALGGFLTNCCVESTMRSGYEKGFEVVTLTDCTATVSEEEQRLAVEKNYPMFSRPMTHDTFLAELGGTTPAADASHGYTR
ncbi:cysteine hydrolase family protein [Roseomonas mucosa]